MTDFLHLDATATRTAGRHRIGLRRIPVAEWIEWDDEVPSVLAARAGLVDELGEEVVGDTGGAEVLAVCTEAADLLGVGIAGRDRAAESTSPLRRIALGVPDDVCLLAPRSLDLIAGAVCFPNRWRLRDKLGRSVLDIHAPVPRYASEVGARVDNVIARLTADAVLERRNWALLDDPALHQPEAPVDRVTPLRAEEVSSAVWARVERQTLRRLPDTGGVVFTIRTRQRRVGELSARDRADLALVLAALPDDVAAYKGLAQLRGPVLDALS